ncbi:hypothetical protein NDU88_003850 [Pleurodeles waltl]|uniref:Uncharacterized protein n=1 Tax=Pleurodeles waltl TaxID=8319 RepID=A0AAV7LGE2_PLEWA|nr:hypothetical protein NDU88_003850 [Pleurodeles waltl]
MMERDAGLCRLSVQLEGSGGMVAVRAGCCVVHETRLPTPAGETPPQARYGPPSSARSGEGGPIKLSPLNRARAQVASRFDPHECSKFRSSTQYLSAAEGEPAHFTEPPPTGPRLKVCGPEAR